MTVKDLLLRNRSYRRFHQDQRLDEALGKPKETVVLEDGSPTPSPYWRDGEGNHHVPKRPLEELLVRLPQSE